SYRPSQVTDGNGINKPSAERKSSTSVLPRNDAVVQSVMSRAARFQGFLPTSNFENLQATSYTSGGEYKPHYDLLSTKVAHTGIRSLEPNETERVTTIFAILDDSCEKKCGTEFSRIRIDWGKEDKKWCRYVDCDAERLTFQPRAGNAIFWKNLRENGSVDENTLHAGLPLLKGVKIGINIWARTGQYLNQSI
ncbi:2OG-Fe oxygenase family protein, partial [Colletotrichum incanum]